MVFPLAWIAVATLGVLYYSRKADSGERFRIVDRTQLKELAVLLEPPSLLAAFSNGASEPLLLNHARILRLRHELTPAEYVETLLEAAALFESGRLRPGGTGAIAPALSPPPTRPWR